MALTSFNQPQALVYTSPGLRAQSARPICTAEGGAAAQFCVPCVRSTCVSLCGVCLGLYLLDMRPSHVNRQKNLPT